MQKSTIKLTKHQLDFATNVEFPLTKRAIIEAICLLFDELGRQLQGEKLLGISHNYKITKGENYQHMPYVVLDYPKISAENFPVLMRTLFWWGHYFSLNLIVRKDLIKLPEYWNDNETYILTGNNLWDNDLTGTNYSLYNKTSVIEREQATHNNYIRLGAKIPITDYEKLNTYFIRYAEWLEQLRYK